MPLVIQPGGLSQKMHARYTARRKLALLASAKRIVEEEGATLHRVAEQLMVCHSLFVRWQKQQDTVGDPILAMLKSKWKASHPGPIGQLKHLKHALLRHVFEQRELGINVHTLDLVIKASSPRVQREALPCKVQCGEAIHACQFTRVLYGHA